MPEFRVSPLSVVNQIKSNLRDRYYSGFPILKELLQNADDAEARHFRIDALPGWPTATNPLLQGPGLLVVNDGTFSEQDKHDIVSFGESGKATDSAAIGKFGIGQKAVFHLCDAFVVHAYGNSEPFTVVVNPFLNLVVDGNVTRDWESLSCADQEYLQDDVSVDFPDQGLVLWLPFRRQGLQPAPGTGFSSDFPSASRAVAEVTRPDDLQTLLTMLRHVESIEIRRHGQADCAVRLDSAAERLLGPQEGQAGFRSFRGKIRMHPDESEAQFVGLEATVRGGRLAGLRRSPHWPKTITVLNPEPQLEKGEPHGAATLSRGAKNGPSQLRISWAVFLPVSEDDDILIPVDVADVGKFHLLLHGYFFLDSGRRSIEGLTEREPHEHPPDAAGLRCAWNAELRDSIVLPLVPATLKDALDSRMLAPAELTELVAAVAANRWFEQNRHAICKDSALVRVWEAPNDTIWCLLPSDKILRPLPKAVADAPSRIAALFAGIHDWARTRDTLLCVDESASLTAEPMHWTTHDLDSLFSSLSSKAFQSRGLAELLAQFLASVNLEENHREVVGPHVVSGLRKAMIETTPLAPSEHILNILDCVPDTLLFPLPASVELRQVFRALAATPASVLPVRSAWVPDADCRPRLSDTDLKALLHALQPHIAGEHADQAATAGLAFLVRAGRGVRELVRDRECAAVKVLRARDLRANSISVLSLQSLFERSQAGLLFASSPEANMVLPLLVDVLPDSFPLIVEGRTAEFLKEARDSTLVLQSAGKPSIFALLNKASRFGPVSARAKLIGRLEPTDQDDSAALRRLCTGAPEAGHIDAEVWLLEDVPGDLERIIAYILGQSNSGFLISPRIAEELSERLRRHLGARALDTSHLEVLFEESPSAFADLELTEPEKEAFLRTKISDLLLRRLPIHDRSDGTVGDAEGVFREADWPIPASLREHVLTLRPCNDLVARARQQNLIPAWSPKHQVETALAQPAPHRLRNDILEALTHLRLDESTLTPEISDALRKVPWLVARDTPVAPEDILSLPESVDEQAMKLLLRGEGPPPFWPTRKLAIDVRNHPGFEYLESHVLPNQRSSFQALALMIDDAAIVGRLGPVDSYPVAEFTALANANADVKLLGWPLLATILTSLTDDREGALKIISAFSEPSDADADLVAQHLDSLAGIAAQRGTNGDAARRAYLKGFEIVANWPEAVRREVFNGTRVPNEAGGWRSGREVIEGGDGIAPAHVLARECASHLRTHNANTVQSSNSDGASSGPVESATRHSEIRDINLAELETRSAAQQRDFLQPWRGRLPSDLVIIYLGLIGRTAALRQIANEWVADATTDVDTLWQDLDEIFAATLRPNPLPVEVDERRYEIQRINGAYVRATALSGQPFDVPLGDNNSGLLVGNLHKGSQGIRGSDDRIRSFITLPVLQLDPSTLNHNAAALVFRGFVETLAADCLWLRLSNQQQALKKILDRSVHVDQSTLQDTQRLLRDRLPTILAELKLATGSRAQQALREYQKKEVRIAHLSGSAQELDSLKTELWQAISDAEASSELLFSVRAKIREFGYSSNRVLFELFQNADDAYRQLDAIPEDACFRVTVISHKPGGFRAIHWGRPINHLGPDPGEGRRLGHDRDLLNMLLMNFSEKRPEDDLTGKFGLGFKSVHMLSDSIGVASGFIALRTLGGFVPKDWSTGIDEAEVLRRHDGTRATMIDVPFSADTSADGGAAVQAFRISMTWMPAFARGIRRIEIGDNNSIAIDCEDVPLLGENAIRVVTVSHSKRDRALRFNLANGYSLLLEMDLSGPMAFPHELGRLWNLAPLEENLRSGWLLNGPFPVDPGRGRLAGSIEDQRETFRRLGRGLGKRLLELHDLASNDWHSFSSALDLDDSEDTAAPLFWSRLFDIFGRDFDDDLAKHLHVDRQGYGRLAAERRVVPTGLPQPFDGLVRASEITHFTQSALSEHAVLVKVRNWPALTDLKRRIVSSEIFGQLGKLGFGGMRAITLTDLLRHEMSSQNRVDAELATRLGKVITMEAIEKWPLDQDRRGILDATKKAYFRCQDGAWRSVRDINSESSEGDEKLLCGFAPESALLHGSYQGASLEFFKVARRESGYGPQAQLLHQWASSANDDDRRRAVLRYIISGRQGRALADEMRNRLPAWLPQPITDLQHSSLLAGWPEEDKTRLLLELGGPGLFSLTTNGSAPDPSPATEEVLQAIHGWWLAIREIERDAYAERVYPTFFSPSKLQATNDRLAWFTMFALACFQSLGRTQDQQHRGFIERGWREAWWQELAESRPTGDFQPWLDRLESWSEPDQFDQEFLPWRRALLDLYTFARGLEEYVQIILQLPRILQDQGPVSLNDILRPSYSPAAMPLGLDAAPVDRSLGIGVNWMIRELVRHGVYEADAASWMVPFSWAASQRVRNLLNELEANIRDEADMDMSPAIYDFVASHLGTDRARFTGDFDLPLQLITRNENRGALEQCFREVGRDAPDFRAAEDSDT